MYDLKDYISWFIVGLMVILVGLVIIYLSVTFINITLILFGIAFVVWLGWMITEVL